ncbi:hypothetical protein A3K02_02080 [candidate division WS6 bacterium RIFOXYD1_FULL_33_8]|uniref:M23ase beta-sheet core domain-containing protein n=2 Tax=Candidatus Dojkabacteria TaxID=74243 RepID=A0A0G0AU96_9BACT|nr:MAG: hypothetical protein UR32_C0019G0028 [candidate division WS6 bacterium GW2011_GWE2_33_157]KKP43846.1 MAG: hypothetical protein UR34_C0010G0011 [candidate division WS6 bacterium GW2011_GWC1_33_20]KKP44363.1 MAG: hypothetical protein UR36_C0018G0028 [candidate division WS6 bacterium GW2011_GWF1_33_233]KKP54848.1 MAG: hypothetical protein UR45_C0008G0026 [candidate division WS6 bacterium GW2011_WS6_33_547]KKP54966.1 MAG: hypothetical protein UR47_C0007G0024 [candidate division WS6 bacteriu
MKNVLKKITIYVLLFFFFFSQIPTTVYAAEACPTSMPIQERYLCLQKELEKLEKNQGTLEKSLKNEDYQQLSLKDKLTYITTQIAQKERIIATLQTEIAAKDIEISLLSKEIQQREDDLSLLSQEITILEQTVNERVTESYKFSFVSPFELFLDVKNIETILRKTKYLLETREKDKSSLKNYNSKVDTLEEEERLLAIEKADLQIKRNSVEEEENRLITEKASLDIQKIEKNSLLAESQRRENEYKTQLAEISSAISATDNIISDVALELFRQGLLGNGTPVVAGQVVGYQGHTGCSFGSHLHFEIRTSTGVKIDPRQFFSMNGRYLSSGTYSAMYRGAYITQYFSSYHSALDMVSTLEGNQNLETYTVPSGLCTAVDNYIRTRGTNQAYLTGEGAPVRAVAAGKVYYGTYSTNLPAYPSKYALVKHNDGRTSFYLHLR